MNDKVSQLLINPPDNWTWLLEPEEVPFCPHCSNELERRIISSSEYETVYKDVCNICGFETEEKFE